MSGKKRRQPDDVVGEDEFESFAENVAPKMPVPRDATRRPSSPGKDADRYYRGLYAAEPDFKRLGQADPEFGRQLRKGSLDFTDPTAVMQLTKTLLKLDFGLKIELPNDRLCPPVPNRHNYILWLKDLMDSTSYDEPGGKVSGLDIGTGASCIYPLLGCAQRQWYFVGTDIDSKSLSFAKRNIELNHLQSRVKIVGREASSALVPLDDLGADFIDFVMTNPPFYHSEDEMLLSAEEKSRPPYSACTGAPVEMVTSGGEVGFVGRIIDESLALRDRVRWYTSMLGKHSSLETLVMMLRDKGVDNYAVAEFVQGHKTRRWAVGWSFGPMRPSQSTARGLRAAVWKKILPPTVELNVLTVSLSLGGGVDAGIVGRLGDRLLEAVSSLELAHWTWDRERLCGVGRARENVWGRAWRRRKLRQQGTEIGAGQPKLDEGTVGSANTDHDDGEDECAFGFEVSITVKRSDVLVSCRWVEGHNSSMFESFVGFLKTRLGGN